MRKPTMAQDGFAIPVKVCGQTTHVNVISGIGQIQMVWWNLAQARIPKRSQGKWPGHWCVQRWYNHFGSKQMMT